MNIFIPQTLESVAELRFLTAVPTQIVSPQASKPIMGLVQDSLLGCYLLSQNKRITQWEMMRLMGAVATFSEYLPSIPRSLDPRWTGQQMTSLFLPAISYKKEAIGDPKETNPTILEANGKVVINGGQMTVGLLDSNTVGKKNNSLFHITWNDHGPTATRDLFDQTSLMANTWLTIRGFSCGIADCVISPDSLDAIRQQVLRSKQTVAEMIGHAKLGELPKGKDELTYKQEFPKKLIETMNKCRGEVEKIAKKSVAPTNSINVMVDCGSKGNKNNISQIVAMIGQQEIEGNWIENQIYRRTLPHFYKDDLRPEAHGFIEDSFMSGLSPTEYWFHAQEGRVGLITKAIKTAETGYIQRKLIKLMEDLHVCYDGTVRNANNMIIQTVYGNDGFDASYLETQSLFFINYNMEKLCFKFQHVDVNQLRSVISPEAFHQLMETPEETRNKVFTTEFKRIVEYHQYLKDNVPIELIQPDVRAPVHFRRLINNMVDLYHLREEPVADINPVYIIEQVDSLRHKIVIDDQNERMNYVSTILINALLSSYLSSKVLIYDHKFNRKAFDHLLHTIYLTFEKVVVNPGDNVGIIGAQSLGEPTTQMALNTFHYTGQGSKANIARGTPRLRELMSLTRNIKTPSMTIHLFDEYFVQKAGDPQVNIDRAGHVSANIEYTTLRDILTKTRIYYDVDDQVTCVPEDQEFVDSYYDLLPDGTDLSSIQSYHWLLRMKFNREMIMKKNIPMYLIEHRLNHYLDDHQIRHTVIVSDDNAMKLICRIKLEFNSSELSDPINYLRETLSKLLDLPIKGIEGITRGLVNPVKKEIVLPNGMVISPFGIGEEYAEASKVYNNFRFLIETEGTNLLEVMRLPNVDMFRTVSNDVWEIYQIYGIEAARKCLIREIELLLEYNETYIQQRHISLLVDVMTNQGTLVSVDRHGMTKSESGPLHRASFEETTKQLTSASIFNEEDVMTGVSSNIMFGQFIPTGTNAFRLAMDMERVLTQTPPTQEIVMPKKSITQTSVSAPTVEVDYCDDANFQFTFHLNQPTSTI